METNVQTFITHLNTYETKKETYVNALHNYHSAKALLIENNTRSMGNSNDISYSNNDYVITREGVLMFKNTKGNNELSGNYFISDKSFLGGKHSNVYVQHDLNDFYYDPSSNTKTTYEILRRENVIQIDDYNGLRCDSYAKMMGKKYYGIDKNGGCYLINDLDDLSATNINIDDEEVSMNNESLTYSKPSDDAEDNTIVLYDISSDKYNTKANLSNYGYVYYDGSFYDLKDETDLSSTTFEEYRNICHSNFRSHSRTNKKNDCILDDKCEGYVKTYDDKFLAIKGPDSYESSNSYLDDNTSSLYLYNCDNSQNIFYHKKRSSRENPNCAYDSSYVRTISHDDWKDISNGNTIEKKWSDLSLCGMEGLLHTNKLALDSAIGEFESAFENMITSFNLLSTHELQMLQESTDVNAEQMTQINQEYQEYIQRTKEVERKEMVYKAQKEDSRILYQSTEYKTTIIALFAIGLSIFTFRYMKK